MRRQWLISAAAVLMAAVGTKASADVPFNLGGAGLDYGKDLRVDSGGNIYSGGYFTGTVDFDPSPTATANLTVAGPGTTVDNYLAKYDPGGNHLWSIRFGGSGSDIPHTIRANGAGVLMGGYFSTSTLNSGRVSFNPASNLAQYTLTSVGNRDPYIVKFDADGQYQWHAGAAASIATANYDEVYDINTDVLGNVYAVGLRNADAAPPNPLTVAGGWVAKYGATGTPQWNFNLGSGASGVVQAFAVDTLSNGNLVVVGQFNTTTDFNHGIGPAINLTPNGNTDLFLAKYDASSGACLGAVKLGGTGFDTGSPGGLRVDGNDNIYITGSLSGTVTADGHTAVSHGAGDALLARYDAGLTNTWLKLLGGGAGDGGHRLELDTDGNPILTGWFRGSATFGPVTLAARSATVPGQDPAASDIFLAKCDALTGEVIWANGFGDATSVTGDFSLGAGLGVDSLGNIVLGGRFSGTVDWDPSAGVVNLTSNGSTDAFVARFDSNGNLATVPEPASGLLMAAGCLWAVARRVRTRVGQGKGERKRKGC